MFEFVNLCYACKLKNRDVEATKCDSGGYICEHCSLTKQIAEISSEIKDDYANNGNLLELLDGLYQARLSLGQIIPLNTIDAREK